MMPSILVLVVKSVYDKKSAFNQQYRTWPDDLMQHRWLLVDTSCRISIPQQGLQIVSTGYHIAFNHGCVKSRLLICKH